MIWCSGRTMSPSPKTSITGSFSFGDVRRPVVRLPHGLAHRVEQAREVSGRGATATYDLYIGVSFIIGSIAAATCACSGRISGYQPSVENGAETSTRRRTRSGCCTASRSATHPPNE